MICKTFCAIKGYFDLRGIGMSGLFVPELASEGKVKYAGIFEKAIEKFHLIKSPVDAAEKLYHQIKPKHEDIEGRYWALWLNLQKAHRA